MRPLRIILSGGGTGGHIFPAVAIAGEIRGRFPDAEILFVGAEGRMEMEKVPAAGYRIEGVPIAGLQRRLTMQNFKLPWLFFKSIVRCRRIIKTFRPDVVVGTGGYVSAPVLFVAERMKIPVLIQEQNSYAGITNKLLARGAARICVAYEGMEKFFPPAKILLTGNPVRKDITDISRKRSEAQKHFLLDANRPTILIIGGSLGARTINLAVAGGLRALSDAGLQVIWQTGKAFHRNAIESAAAYPSVHVYDFISRMDLAYAAADVAISRAGAGSVSELCITGLPAILVPSPNVAEDHQTKNAMALVRKKAALMVQDNSASSELVPAVIALCANDTQRRSLSENIRKMAFHNSAGVIADEVLKLAKR